jgi:hypothetical protein
MFPVSLSPLTGILVGIIHISCGEPTKRLDFFLTGDYEIYVLYCLEY